MPDRTEKAARFRALHEGPNRPLLLYNAWDAGSARAIELAGAAAIATSSWAVAASQGYEDGEDMPRDLAVRAVMRIVAATTLPVSADIEGGYAAEPEAVGANALRFIVAGIAGLNIEDRIIGKDGLYTAALQARRIAAIRKAAREAGMAVFINARTDLFFGAAGDAPHSDLLGEAAERAEAYAAAGAGGLFVPGLADPDLLAALCEKTALPVNVMMGDGMPPMETLRQAGAARISFGPAPYIEAMAGISRSAKAVHREF